MRGPWRLIALSLERRASPVKGGSHQAADRIRSFSPIRSDPMRRRSEESAPGRGGHGGARPALRAQARRAAYRFRKVGEPLKQAAAVVSRRRRSEEVEIRDRVQIRLVQPARIDVEADRGRRPSLDPGVVGQVVDFDSAAAEVALRPVPDVGDVGGEIERDAPVVDGGVAVTRDRQLDRRAAAPVAGDEQRAVERGGPAFAAAAVFASLIGRRSVVIDDDAGRDDLSALRRSEDQGK